MWDLFRLFCFVVCLCCLVRVVVSVVVVLLCFCCCGILLWELFFGCDCCCGICLCVGFVFVWELFLVWDLFCCGFCFGVGIVMFVWDVFVLRAADGFVCVSCFCG